MVELNRTHFRCVYSISEDKYSVGKLSGDPWKCVPGLRKLRAAGVVHLRKMVEKCLLLIVYSCAIGQDPGDHGV